MDLPKEFWLGVEEFNRGEFYACHDTLEALWMDASDPERTFYQGILQLAVACYHLGNGNQQGAMILLGEGMNRLQPYRDHNSGLALDDLLQQSQTLLAQLHTLSTAEIQPGSIPWQEAVAALPRPKIKWVGEYYQLE
jgi:uncharacterized protein